MLTLFRDFAQSIYAKILIAALIVSLALFGLTSVFFAPLRNALVSSGDQTLMRVEFERFVRNYQQNIARDGDYRTRNELAQSGDLRALYLSLRQRIQQLAYADQLGLTTSDKKASEQVKRLQIGIDGLTGRFSAESYQQSLRRMGLTRDVFERQLKEDATLETLTEVGSIALQGSDIFARQLLMFQSEARHLRYFEIDRGHIEEIGAPSEDELRSYYEDNLERFKAPERRRLSVIHLKPDDFVHRAEPSEDMLLVAYDDFTSKMTLVESREFTELSYRYQNHAEAALDGLKMGTSPEAVAATTRLLDMAVHKKAELDIDDPVYGAEIFAAELGSAVGPFEVSGEWKVVIVNSVDDGKPSFEEMRPTLVKQSLSGASQDNFYDALDPLVDLLGSGTPLEVISEDIGTPVYHFPPIDNFGRSEDGVLFSILRQDPLILETAFALAEDEVSYETTLADGSIVVIHVTDVELSHQPQFASIEDRLAVVYQGEKQAEALLDKATVLKERLFEGESLESVAESLGVDVITPESPLNRSNANAAGFTPQFLQVAFSKKQGEAFSAPTNYTGGYGVGVIEEISLNEEISPAAIASLRATRANELGDDLSFALNSAIINTMPARESIRRVEDAVNPRLEDED